MLSFEHHFVDLKVYSANRLFRMLGCAKRNSDRYLTNNEEYTFENWVKNKIQPVETDDEFVNVKEMDGSEPCHATGGGVSLSLDSSHYLKPVFDLIHENEKIKVARIQSFPLTLSVACNLNTKYCPFKGDSHSKNHIYA